MKPSSTPTAGTAIIALIALTGCSTFERLFERERKVRLEAVPAEVKTAAETVVPGLVLMAAEVEGRNDAAVYELKGKAGAKAYEIEVTAGGKVMGVAELAAPADDD